MHRSCDWFYHSLMIVSLTKVPPIRDPAGLGMMTFCGQELVRL